MTDSSIRSAIMAALGVLPLVFGFAATGRAQDSRTVTEPATPAPPYCQVLPASLPVPAGGLFDAAAEATPPDTARINAAIAACSAISRQSSYRTPIVVQLAANGANLSFLSGPITMQSGVTLLVAPGVTLYASRNANEYDLGTGTCGQLAASGSGCTNFINAGSVQNIGFIGPGTIDGRGYAVIAGTSNPSNYSWWDLAAAAVPANLNQNNPRLIQLNGSQNVTFYNINLQNSPKFHVAASKVNGVTAWGVSINTPATARNTDGFDPGGANWTITQSYINAGDDNVAIKGGNALATNMSIAHNHFYRGHGMSIGSETNAGVSNIAVSDLSLDGTDNGLRIKSDSSRGGLVTGVSYADVCMRNVPDPLVFSAYYSTATGSLYPNFAGVALHGVHSLTPGALIFQGYSANYPLRISLDNVVVDGQDPAAVQASDAIITLGPGPVNFVPSGFDTVVYDQRSQAASPVDCSSRFVAFQAAGRPCDADGNGQVDRDDIAAIVAARNTPAGQNDPRDADRDGVITVLDARLCVQLCTKAGCAP